MMPFENKRQKPYNGRIQAVVLDWAGTAVDYGCIGPAAVFIDVFEKFKVTVTIDEARQFMGLMKKDHIRSMCDLPSVRNRWLEAYGRSPAETDVEAMYREMESMMVAAIARHSDPIPGLLETISALKKRNIKIGACTGYTGAMMEVLVGEAENKGYHPDATVCSTDVPAGRPAPFMCYLNAVQLAVYPMASMVKIGDTISDIEEGLNAGMWTIGLSQSGNELGLAEADLKSFSQAELKQRIADIEQRFYDAGAHFTAKGIWEIMPLVDQIEELLSKGQQP
jgi:phosphonoacetaldehyde hydrolase